MDIAALLGFIGAVGMILAAMIAGGGVAPFVDNQSILIVFGGSFFRCHVHRSNADLFS
jgi:chemotaxis protein MotA